MKTQQQRTTNGNSNSNSSNGHGNGQSNGVSSAVRSASAAVRSPAPAGAIGATEGVAAEPRAKRRHKEVWLVEEHPNRKAWWTRVGVAFENKDGSWNLHLSAVPVGGNILHVRDPRPAEVTHDDAANDDVVHGAGQQVAA